MMRCELCEAAMVEVTPLREKNGYYMICSVGRWNHPWRVFYNATYNQMVGVEKAND